MIRRRHLPTRHVHRWATSSLRDSVSTCRQRCRERSRSRGFGGASCGLSDGGVRCVGAVGVHSSPLAGMHRNAIALVNTWPSPRSTVSQSAHEPVGDVFSRDPSVARSRATKGARAHATHRAAYGASNQLENLIQYEWPLQLPRRSQPSTSMYAESAAGNTMVRMYLLDITFTGLVGRVRTGNPFVCAYNQASRTCA